MGKTVEQKLMSAKEVIRNSKSGIKALERKIYALNHQVTSLLQQRSDLQNQAKIKDAQLQSADMFISYLQSLVSTNNEIRIPLHELYKFNTGYHVLWKKDDNTKEIIIKTVPLVIPDSKTISTQEQGK